VNVERKTGHHLLWPSNANQNRFVAGAVCDFERKSPEQARAAGNLGDRPLIVLTAGLPIQFGDPEADKELVAFHEIWSINGRPNWLGFPLADDRLLWKTATTRFDPDAVFDAIHEVVIEVRGK